MDFYTFDDEYVRRLREGDRWTVEHFVRYFNNLMLIKLRSHRFRSAQGIDDVRQEVFVRVFRALRLPGSGPRDGRKLGAFVNSICNNVVLEHFRKNGHTESLDEKHSDVPDASAGVVDALVTAETKERVKRVLSNLPKKDADLLQALFFEERDKDQICRDFGVDRNYLRVLLHRAKEKFRSDYLDADGEVAMMDRKRPSTSPPPIKPPWPRPGGRDDS